MSALAFVGTRWWAAPFVHQGFAYWVNRVGVVYCIDVVTGEQKYAQRTKQSCWATPLPLGDRIYFFGKDGITTVIAAVEVMANFLAAKNSEVGLKNVDVLKPSVCCSAQTDAV